MKEIDAVRRIVSRSGRLKKLIEMEVPPVIIENERSLLKAGIRLWETVLDTSGENTR